MSRGLPFSSLFAPIAAAVTGAVLAYATVALAADPESVPAPQLQAGDSWVFDDVVETGPTGYAQARQDMIIERVQSDAMVVGAKRDGAPTAYQDRVDGLDWSHRLLVGDHQETTTRPFQFPLKIGATWIADYTDPEQHGQQLSAHIHNVYKVVGWTDVTVPAGKFRALKIEQNGVDEAQIAAQSIVVGGAATGAGGATALAHTQQAPAHTAHVTTYVEIYYVPEIKYFAKLIEEQYNAANVRTRRETQQLVSFKAGTAD